MTFFDIFFHVLNILLYKEFPTFFHRLKRKRRVAKKVEEIQLVASDDSLQSQQQAIKDTQPVAAEVKKNKLQLQ